MIMIQCIGTSYKETAFAKVNLTLSVLGKRDDGYHQLESLVVFAGVGDELVFSPLSKNSSPSQDRSFQLRVVGSEAMHIEGENLVETVGIQLLNELTQFASSQTYSQNLGEFQLEKKLPVAAGLGGGSADAAALIRILNHYFSDQGFDLSRFDFLKFSQKFGADIPVCVSSNPAFMHGIGEIVEPIDHIPQMHMLLVNPRIAVPTGSVFKALNAAPYHEGEKGTIDELRSLVLSDVDGVIDVMEKVPNDLLQPALKVAPQIGDVLAEIGGLGGCLISRLSGSGATCFGLFETKEDLQRGGSYLRSRFPKWWIADTFVRPFCSA